MVTVKTTVRKLSLQASRTDFPRIIYLERRDHPIFHPYVPTAHNSETLESMLVKCMLCIVGYLPAGELSFNGDHHGEHIALIHVWNGC